MIGRNNLVLKIIKIFNIILGFLNWRFSGFLGLLSVASGEEGLLSVAFGVKGWAEIKKKKKTRTKLLG